MKQRGELRLLVSLRDLTHTLQRTGRAGPAPLIQVGRAYIDIADLARAGAVLRYQAAAEAIAVIESRPGAFQDFWVAAVTFWCDVQPILRAEWDGRLDALAR